MSNPQQALSAVVGGVVGFVVSGFNPLGAIAGVQYGLLAGSLLFPTQLDPVQGPRIEDFETLSVDPGSPVLKGWGIYPAPGFRLYLGEAREHSDTESVGGKGGPQQDVTTFTYTQTIAIGLGEGPINGVMRIWENGELVYDARPQQPGEASEAYAARADMSAEYGQTFVLYTGTYTQLPDPTLELAEGTGNMPAYRGLAYLVYPDRVLRSDQGNRHPMTKFELAERGDYIETTILTVGAPSNPINDAEVDKATAISSFSGATDLGNSPMQTTIAIVYIEPLNRWVVLSANAAGTLGPTDGGHMPIRLSNDDGATWGLVASGPTTWFEHKNLIYAEDWNRVITCGGQNVFEAFYSNNGGTDWSTASLTAASSGGEICNRACAVYAKPVGGSASVVAMLGAGSRCFTTTDGLLWTRRSTNVAAGGPIAFSPTRGLYAMLSGNAIYTATDPTSWTSRATCTTNNGTGPSGGSICWDPYQSPPCFIAIGNEGVQRSVDGLTWTVIGAAPQRRNVIFPSRRRVLYASKPTGSTSGSEATFDYSVDGGITWQTSSFSSSSVRWWGWAEKVTLFISGESVALSRIVEEISARCGVTAVGATDLEDILIDGYALSRDMTASAAIAPLRMVGRFDTVESGAVVKFVARGKAPVATLAAAELGAHEYGTAAPPAISTLRAQDLELPRRVRLRFISKARDYEPGEQLSPARIGVGVSEVTVECPVVMSEDLAAQTAEVSFRDLWASRVTHQTVVDHRRHALEPSDPILVPVDDRLYRARIVSITDASPVLRRLELARDDSRAYVSTAVGAPPARPPSVVSLLGETEALFLDLPALVEQNNDAGFYAVAWRAGVGTTWPGARIFKSVDGGATFAQLGAIAEQAIYGQVVSAPASGDTATWSSGAYVIDVLNGTLESRNDAALQAGANAAVVGAPGRWHIFQFGIQSLVSPARYQLTKLLLGRRGTEHLVGTVVPGDRFVLISGPGVHRLAMQSSEIGTARTYRAVTNGAAVSSAADFVFTGSGAALETFSPYYIRGSRDGSGNLTITWLRRDRLSATLRPGIATPMSEASAAYEVDVMNGASVVRTISGLSAETASYSAANQTTDFGSAQASITIRVYQLSAVVGRGTAGVATI